MTHLFLSYSRKDSAPALALKAALEARGGCEVWMDVADIPPASRFREEIRTAIEHADVILFLLSTASVASVECGIELAYSLEQHKKIVPVAIQNVEGATAPEALRDMDWVLMRNGAEWESGLVRLEQAIEQDLDWLHEMAGLLVGARRWETRSREATLLLPGKEIKRIEELLRRGNAKKPPPSELQREFVRASREAWERSRRWRRRGAITIAALLIVAGGLAAWWREASRRDSLLTAASRLALDSEAQLPSHSQRGLLLAVEAYELGRQGGQPRFPAAEKALRRALLEVGGIGLRGHAGPITALAISPNGSEAATASRDGSVKLWDLNAGDPTTPIATLRGWENPVWSLAFDPSGRWLVAASLDNTVRLFDLKAGTGESRATFLPGHHAQVLVAAFSPDGRWLATASADKTARVWEMAANGPKGAARVLLGHTMAVRALTFSRDGHWLVTASDDRTVRVWSLEEQSEVAQPRAQLQMTGPVPAVGFSGDGKWLIAADLNGAVRKWRWSLPEGLSAPVDLRPAGKAARLLAIDLRTPSQWAATTGDSAVLSGWYLEPGTARPNTDFQLTASSNLTAIAAVPSAGMLDARIVTAGADGNVQLWDLNRETLLANLRGHEGPVSQIAISTNRRWLLTGGEDGVPRLWPLDKPTPGNSPIVLESHPEPISGLALGTSGRWLVSACQDGTARLWDLSARDPFSAIFEFSGHEKGSPLAVALSADEHWLATGSSPETSRLWRMEMPSAPVERLRLDAHSGFIKALTFSADSRWLATASLDQTARLWRLDATEIRSFKLAHGNFVLHICIDPTSLWAVTGGQDGRVLAWKMADDFAPVKPIALPGMNTTQPITALAFSRGPGWLAAGGLRAAWLWEAGFLRNLTRAEPRLLPAHQRFVGALAFSPGGHFLATGDDEGRAFLWQLQRLERGVPIRIFGGHEGAVSATAFSPDERWLATGVQSTGAVRLWNTDTGQVVTLGIAPGGIRAMAFTPDGRWLISAGEDGRTCLWHTNPDELATLAQRTAGRDLSADERAEFLAGK